MTQPEETHGRGGPAHRYSAGLADAIERKWQSRWEEEQTFRAPNPGDAGFDPSRPKYYVLDMFPYPSGAGLHVGHPEGYIATDIVARYRRMKGDNVLHPMGWDAFGLPAEQYAIQTGIHPAQTTRKAIDTFRRQLKRFGFSYDWSREFGTIDEDYYRWTQWIFLRIYHAWYDRQAQRGRPIADLIDECTNGHIGIGPEGEAIHLHFDGGRPPAGVRLWEDLTAAEQRSFIDGQRLAYIGEQTVNWCPKLGTVLANEEVIDGRSERGGLPGPSKAAQAVALPHHRLRRSPPRRSGRPRLAHLHQDDAGRMDRPQRRGGDRLPPRRRGREAPGLHDAPGHDLRRHLHGRRPRASDHRECSGVGGSDRLCQGGAPSLRCGAAGDQGEERRLPRHPCHQSRHREEDPRLDGRLRPHGLRPWRHHGGARPRRARPRVRGGKGTPHRGGRPARGREGRRGMLQRRRGRHPLEQFRTLPRWSAHARGEAAHDRVAGEEGARPRARPIQAARLALLAPALLGRALPHPLGRKGEPSSRGGERPPRHPARSGGLRPRRVGGSDPPSRQGDRVAPDDRGRAGVKGLPPETPLRREANTMPGWAGSCWYYLRYCDPRNSDRLASRAAEEYWMGGQGVDLYIGGAEHAVLHLLYARFWHKVLFDLGEVSSPEPFARLFHQGMITSFAYQRADKSLVPTDEVEERDGSAIERATGAEVTTIIAKMSKSLRNVINPDDVIADYGADTFRLYEMYMGPRGLQTLGHPRHHRDASLPATHLAHGRGRGDGRAAPGHGGRSRPREAPPSDDRQGRRGHRTSRLQHGHRLHDRVRERRRRRRREPRPARALRAPAGPPRAPHGGGDRREAGPRGDARPRRVALPRRVDAARPGGRDRRPDRRQGAKPNPRGRRRGRRGGDPRRPRRPRIAELIAGRQVRKVVVVKGRLVSLALE
ncbi:MAG: class I tRNA ligase family protein [Planctomycetes bacterium]|nr:class I tRNA ligase family protein [Planctomycetota bacterium]